MRFWQRLRYYMIGVGLGLLVTFFFFRNRGCGWLPQNRVLDRLESSVILRTDSMACVLQRCNAISDEDVFHLLREGDVVFSEGRVDVYPKEYVVASNRKADGSPYKLRFALYDTTSLILGVENPASCTCKDFADTALHILSMPEKMLKEMFLNKEFTITTEGKCMMDCIGVSAEDVVDLIQKGGINNETSTPFSFPHPRYVVVNKEYTILVEMTKEKTRILSIQREGKDCACEP